MLSLFHTFGERPDLPKVPELKSLDLNWVCRWVSPKFRGQGPEDSLILPRETRRLLDHLLKWMQYRRCIPAVPGRVEGVVLGSQGGHLRSLDVYLSQSVREGVRRGSHPAQLA